MSRGTVMVVEDDPDLREVIAEVLAADRFTVVQAANGADALDLLRSAPELPSLILLDLMMPVMNGMQFRAVQRADPRLAAIPVVVMSAVTDGEAKTAALDPAAFLRKPTDREGMLAMVRQHCRPVDGAPAARWAGRP